MTNQYKIPKKKELDVLMAYFFCHWSQKTISLRYRLSSNTVKRIIQKSIEDSKKILESGKNG
ncbi:MAG: hypothetical protein WC543_06020 [Candidatus Omnitrophota bacterium]